MLAPIEQFRNRDIASNEEALVLQVVRDSLPIRAVKEEIKNAIANNQVVIIAGVNGTGKTTQVPQYILEMPGQTDVVCTQLHKIGVTEFAKRICKETGTDVGDFIGYIHPLGEKKSDRTVLTFMTNEVLIRLLLRAPDLNMFSAVVIDDVQMLTMGMNIAMGIVKKIAEERPELRVVIMSARMDVDSYAHYFSGAQVVRVPVIRSS